MKKALHPGYAPVQSSVSKSTNQSISTPGAKTETSQRNLYESESPSSMNVNVVAMPQYKPTEVTML